MRDGARRWPGPRHSLADEAPERAISEKSDDETIYAGRAATLAAMFSTAALAQGATPEAPAQGGPVGWDGGAPTNKKAMKQRKMEENKAKWEKRENHQDIGGKKVMKKSEAFRRPASAWGFFTRIEGAASARSHQVASSETRSAATCSSGG